ncbi:lysophospholipase L2 [Lachnospiraceae bacterium KM106-2]|nr:lysophospholipase L2 [Lachnospiraceae bacterium KM106-2]
MYVSITRDKLTLRGKLEKQAEGSCPIAILFHGFTGDIGDEPDHVYQKISNQLNHVGIATIRFDFNGHGKSDGDFRAMNLFNELNDAIAILSYVRKLDFVTDIYLIGHSQGSVVAGMLAGYYNDVIAKLVLLAPAATLKTDALAGKCMDAVYDPNHIPETVDVDGGNHLVGGHYFRIAKSFPIYEVTAQFKGPSLAIHGIFDQIVNADASRKYHKTLSNCQLELLHNLDHGLYGEDQAHMLTLITDFLDPRKKDSHE